MKHILYIVYYGNNYYTCPGHAHSFTSIHDSKLIHIFNDLQIRDLYNNYFASRLDDNKFITECNLKKFLSDYISKYNWFIFLSNNCLYKPQFYTEVSTICDSTPSGCFLAYSQPQSINNRIIGINNQHLQQYLQFNYKIQDLLELSFNNIESYPIFNAFNLTNKNVIDNSFHSDEYCIFANFINPNTNQLKNSFAYINKKNHRVYNIVNNLAGYITENNTDYSSVSIEWNIEKDTIQTIKYRLDQYSKVYYGN